MREALVQHPGQPLEVHDDEMQKVCLLVDSERGRALTEQWLRDELQVGLDAASRGEVVPFDVEEIKADGRADKAHFG